MTLSFPLYVALRYLKSARRDAYVTFLSLVAMGGLTLGVAALVLALAAISGFQRALRGEVLARTPQVEVRPRAATDAADVEAMRAAVAASPGVTRVLVTVRGRGWILLRGTAVPLEIVGASPGVPRWFPQAPSDQPGLVVSERIAARLGLGVGEPATLVSPVPGLTPLGPQPRLRTVPFAGTYRAGRSDPDERAAVPLEVAVRLFGNAEKVLDVEVESLDHAVAVAASIRRAFPTAEVATWQELNRGLFFALRLERTVMFVAVGLIVLVAALALVSDLGLIITNKRAEIGILGTMGAGASELRAVFTWLGGVIAFVGIFCGLAFGVTAAVVLDRTRGLALPGGGFFLDYVPFHVEAGDVLTVSLATAALSWIFCRSAAGAAVKLRPVEALRRA